MDKVLNSHCACKKYLNLKSSLTVVLPCEHILHYDCVHTVNKNMCPICDTKITNIFTDKEIKQLAVNNMYYYQLFVDTTAVKLVSKTDMMYSNMMSRMPDIMTLIKECVSINSVEDVYNCVDKLIELCRIDIVVVGKKNLYNGKKVIIANHSNYADSLILSKLFRCGFVASKKIIDNLPLHDKIVKYFPLICIERGGSNGVVEQMNSYIKNKGDICVFPEGMITNSSTISRFRTGSFYTGYPVQPVSINFSPSFDDGDMTTFFMKLLSQDKIVVTVNILQVEHPPFNKSKIEYIRCSMAHVGNFAVSRVSNKDVYDKKVVDVVQ